MGVEEFFGWVQYYNEEPWGNIVDGYRNASIACNSFNAGVMAANPKDYRKNRAKVEDFLIGVNLSDKVRRDSFKCTMSQEKQSLLLSRFKAMAAGRAKK